MIREGACGVYMKNFHGTNRINNNENGHENVSSFLCLLLEKELMVA